LLRVKCVQAPGYFVHKMAKIKTCCKYVELTNIVIGFCIYQLFLNFQPEPASHVL